MSSPNSISTQLSTDKTSPKMNPNLRQSSLESSGSPNKDQDNFMTPKRHREEHHLGVILVAVSSIFIVCQSLKIIPDMYELVWCTSKRNSDCPMHGISNTLMRLSHLLVCVNSTANFLLYYVHGKKFRLAWKRIYGFDFLCRRKRDLRQTSVRMQFRNNLESNCSMKNQEEQQEMQV